MDPAGVPAWIVNANHSRKKLNVYEKVSHWSLSSECQFIVIWFPLHTAVIAAAERSVGGAEVCFLSAKQANHMTVIYAWSIDKSSPKSLRGCGTRDETGAYEGSGSRLVGDAFQA